MLEKLPVDDHRDLFLTRLADLLNPKHELVLLSNAIDWNYFENEFKTLYSDKPNRPLMPVRLMVGVLIFNIYTTWTTRKYPKFGFDRLLSVFLWLPCSSSINFRAIRAILFIFANG
jgi:IS5 family transposase